MVQSGAGSTLVEGSLDLWRFATQNEVVETKKHWGYKMGPYKPYKWSYFTPINP